MQNDQHESHASASIRRRLPYVWFLDVQGGRVPFGQTKKQQGSWVRVFCKWFVPGFLNGSCIFISMWLLHVATYKYVHRMTSMEGELSSDHVNVSKAEDIVHDFGGLTDTVSELFPHKTLPLPVLDTAAATIPMTFMLGVFVFDDLDLYTKIMFCNGMLALLKGSCDILTVSPDSAGWQACRTRLTPLGVAYMKDDHSPLDLLVDEVTGVNGKHLRWCADMLLSGHTYFTTIYALALYELVRKVTRGLPPNDWIKVLAIMLVVAFTCAEQLLEMYFVLVDRFHYSVDLYLALVLTFLIFSNVVPATVAKWWVFYGTTHPKDMMYFEEALSSQSDILVPVCCVPFCCSAGRYHVYDDLHMQNLIDLIQKDLGASDMQHLSAMNNMERGIQLSSLLSNRYAQVSDTSRTRRVIRYL